MHKRVDHGVDRAGGGGYAPAAAGRGARCSCCAYYIALERGCDIDKPRNLAKSVTVE